MPSDEKDIGELERALGGLQPARAGFDRDRLMFQAGQASAPRRLLWPAAAGLMTAVAASLGLFLVLRPAAEPVIEVVYVKHPVVAPQPAPAPPKSPEPQPAPVREGAATPSVLATSSYWRLQEIAVRHGVEELPDAAPSGAARPTPDAATSIWDWRSRPETASSLYHSGVE